METLDLPLPRPVESLHQIELTSRCSLRCVYCPSPNLGRPKLDMSREHLYAALEHLKYYVKRGTQDGEVNVAGIGESTMRVDAQGRPDFTVCVDIIRRAVPEIPILFATNGLHLTEEMARDLKAIGNVHLWVSLHRPEKAGPAFELAKKYGLVRGVSMDPSVNADDWAGQVKWHRSYMDEVPCNWIRKGWAMAMADGRITACCLDATGAGVIGHVNDPVGSLKTKPYSLCGGCQQRINVKGYEQK